MTGQLGRRGRGKFATISGRPLNLHRRGCAIEQRHTDRHDEEELILLREIAGGRQSATRLVAVARTGNGLGMFLRAAILFAQQARRINQTARSRWQPNERQHQRDRCLDTLHGRSNTTEARPEQSGRLAELRGRLQPAAETYTCRRPPPS